MTFEKTKFSPPSITPTRLQLLTVVVAASFAAALLLAIIACSPEPPQPSPTSTAVPTYTPTPRPTATREPLDPKVRYNLSGQAGNEFSTYATAIAEGTPPEEADREVEAWMMAREGHKGSKEVVDFLLTAGISENAILVEDVTPCYIYVIARVPVSLLRPLDKHPYMLILTLGPKTSAESLPSEPTAPAVAPIQKPVCLPDATPSAEAGGMAQEAMDLMKLRSLYAIQDTPLTELADYFEAIDRGVSSEDADRDVQAWIAVEGGDAGTRAVSEFLRINGISEDSLRLVKEWIFSYIVARVPVSLLIRLSQHPNVIYVGDRVPTEFEKESFPAVSTATPAPTPTPSDARPSQQPLKPVQKYGLTGPPFFELRTYLDAIARGVTPENANKTVETWIWVADDAGTRAVSEFLLTNGVSEDSLRVTQNGRFRYVVAQVPVPLLIPLSEHPHALHVGDRIPTEVEPRDPSLDFSPTPTPPSEADSTSIQPPSVYSKLGMSVAQLITEYETAIANGASGQSIDSGLVVAVYMDGSDNHAYVTEFLDANGIKYRSYGSWHFLATVPLSLIGQLSELPGVSLVDEPEGFRFGDNLNEEASGVGTLDEVVAPTPTSTPPSDTAGTAQQPLKPIEKYKLTGKPSDALATYLDEIASGESGNADREVDAWIWVADDAGIQAISEFLQANDVPEYWIDDGTFLYVVARVPVWLLIPLSEHPHALNVGDRLPTEVEPRDPSLDFSPTPTPTPTPSNTPTPTPTVTPTPPLTPTPTTTSTPPSDTAGTAQQPLKQLEYYGLTGKPFEALGIYLDEIASGASGNADVEVETWIWVAGDAGVQAISEFLLANGVSEYSIRADSYFTYVVANVPVRLLIPLAEHPHQLNVGDRLPTEVEPRDPSIDFSPTPTPTATSTPTPTGGIGTATPTPTSVHLPTVPAQPAGDASEQSPRVYPKLFDGLEAEVCA